MTALGRVPLIAVACMIALVATVTGNLSGLGIGSASLLYDPMALPRLAVAAVLTCLAWLTWALSREPGRFTMRFDAVLGVLMALAAWAAVSAAASPHAPLGVLGQSERLEGAVTVALYALVYGITLQVVRRVRDARVLAAALATAAVVLSVYGLVQFAGLDPTGYSHEAFGFDLRRAFATTGNPNFLAGLLVLALPVTAALACGQSGWRRVAWTAGAFVIAGALFATFTRGAWLAVGVQAVVVAYLLRHRWRGIRLTSAARMTLIAGIVVTLAIVGVSLASSGEINVAERISSAFVRNDSTAERVLIADVAFDAVGERPVLGYGPDSFLPAFREHRTTEYADTFGETATMNNAHSWLLQYMVALGIPGALLLAAALGLGLVRGRPRSAAAGESSASPGSALMAAIWVGCIGACVHFIFNVGVLGVTLPLFVMLGVIMAPAARDIDVAGGVRIPAVAVAAALTVLVAFGAVSALRADASYLASRLAYHGLTDADPIALAKEAATLNPLSVKYSRGVAQARARVVETAMAQGSSPEDVRALYAEARVEFDRVLERSPADYPARAWLAALQANVGVYAGDQALLGEAAETARVAAQYDRQHAEVRALAGGDTSRSAILTAASVLPLP